MKTFKKMFTIWVIILFLATFTSSLVYLVAQQTIRLGANAEPMRLATDIRNKLQSGQNAETIFADGKSDAIISLNSFAMVFDSKMNLVATSGTLRGDLPVYPSGVFDRVQPGVEARVTWQPEPSQRFATVAVKYDGGYVVGAQSLKEPEKLIEFIGDLVVLAWLVCAGFSGAVLAAAGIVMKRKAI
jgi:hypothetical protein